MITFWRNFKKFYNGEEKLKDNKIEYNDKDTDSVKGGLTGRVDTINILLSYTIKFSQNSKLFFDKTYLNGTAQGPAGAGKTTLANIIIKKFLF